jgi:ribosomal protein L12E/L44/L45/RPP1/RPP2
LADPSAFAVAAPVETKAAETKVEAKKEEAKEESDEDMGFGLFD